MPSPSDWSRRACPCRRPCLPNPRYLHSGGRLRLGLGAALVAGLVTPGFASGQWVEPPGLGWASVAFYGQNSRSVYLANGDKGSFVLDGQTRALSIYVTGVIGVVPGVDVWLQPSFHRLRFEDLTGTRVSTGPGDTRLYVRAAPLSWLGEDLPLALRAGVKLPVGDFDVGQELIPLGDGQRDWELILELGQSLYPRPLYLMGWLGRRWRESTDDPPRDFGDEWFFLAAVGGDVGRWGYKASVEGWFGETPQFGGLNAQGQEREMVRIGISASPRLGPGSLEVGARIPLMGKNLPAGTELVAGYFLRFGG